jgi:hypothetical protein
VLDETHLTGNRRCFMALPRQSQHLPDCPERGGSGRITTKGPVGFLDGLLNQLLTRARDF